MPTNTSHTLIVSIPSVADFAARFPQYGPKASSDGAHYFDLVMRPESFLDASAVTRCLRVPAVSAIAHQATALSGGEISGPDKQFLGALMCTLMEHNGFVKTGRSRSVPQRGWNRGHVYAQTESQPASPTGSI